MKLECYPLVSHPPELVPGRPLPRLDGQFRRPPLLSVPSLSMANTSLSWELLCPMGFTATWNGGPRIQDITFIPEKPHPDFHSFALSHFSHGVVTFPTGYMFRTPTGWSILCGG